MTKEKRQLVYNRLNIPMISHIPIAGIVQIGRDSSNEKTTSHRAWAAECIRQFFEGYIRDEYRYSLDMSWTSWCWASECNISIDFDELKVRISWSSTGRTPLQAIAAISMYQQVTEYAAKIQAIMDELRDSKEYAEAK